ncbi:dienelactone hydrolase family protein [Rhodosalinus sp. K401]|uniref:dienelactone hydrolase family protein n=1 Tax=Rhodosalinus sp. K401 TaxID=3239195 RepID=UPI0035248D67
MTGPRDIELDIPVSSGRGRLEGDLALPDAPRGLVVFAHGSGSSRFSPRNRAVAEWLGGRGYATLLFDLLTPGEARDRSHVFDIPLLAGRVGDALSCLGQEPAVRGLRIGLFGASTGAAAALVAAAERPEAVSAVVSRGGRPDLAGASLQRVHAPTLLVVGGRDTDVIALNEEALTELPCEKRLAIVPGATHLFEEPGTLRAMMEKTASWFDRHLAGSPASPHG